MTIQENPAGYKFTILSEDVASKDLFEDKTHERVSENLYKIIQGSAKGVTIGLEGSWGSGKSTVIKLLKDKLTESSDNKTLFFMFDAWAHDGDPLRRIFLESLIREIDPNEKDEELNAIKGNITGRKKIVEVKSKKSASRLGKLISLSALLIPLGSALLGKVNYDLLVWPWSDEAHHFNTMLALGLTFCLSPAWILLYWCVRGDKLKNKISWDFFSVDTREDYTQDITEDGERTSIEFEDHFQCIIKTATKKELIDKCIVVIDNLDRVDSGHAKSIWSTLQTFFQKRSSGNAGISWSDKLWFIIPFDYDGFLKIWGSTDVDNNIGKSFLKKCFQLIAEVPHPVMSGWSRYAETCINEALSQWPEHERKGVLSTYVRYASRLDKSPTPRDIKVFANQVGLLGAMWGGQASVEAICLYALFKESFTTNELRGHLVAGQLPQTYQTDADRSDICAELAGLLFGVNKQKGLQLLLGPEIKSAFNLGDGKIISTLLEDHGSAFWIAYEHSKSDWMVGGGHTDEYKISFTKAFHEGLSTHKSRIHRDIQQLARVWINSLDSLNFSNFDYSASLDSIIEISDDKDTLVNSLHKFMLNKVREIVALVGTEKFPESSLANIENVTDLLAKLNKPLTTLRPSKLTAENWRIWLDHLANSETRFDFILPKDETITALVAEAQLTASQPDDEALEHLTKTFDINPNSSEWLNAADQIIKWMKIPNRSSDCEVVYDLAIKLSVNQKNSALSKFKSCLEQAPFWVSGQNSSCEDNPSLPVLAAITLEDELQEIGHVSSEVKSFWSDTKDSNELTEIFNRLKRLNKLDTLWELCRDDRNSVAVEIIKNSDDPLLFSNRSGAKYIDEYDWASEEEVQNIAAKLATNGSFFNNENNMKDKAITYQAVYKIFYALNNPEISEFIDTEINKVKKDDWQKCIEGNGELLDIVKNKNPHFSEALNEYLIGVVSGKISTGINSGIKEKLSALLGKVTDLHKNFIPKVMKAYFSTDNDYLKDDEFNMLCPLFSQHLSGLDESSLMERINLWVKSNAKERIQWLTAQNIKPFKEPSETLIALVELGLESDEIIQNEIANLVNTKLSLGIAIQTSESENLGQDMSADKSS